MRIDRHRIPDQFLREMQEDIDADFDELSEFVQGASEARNLSLLISNARRAGVHQLVRNPNAPRGVQALRIAARASAALFEAKSASPSSPVSVTLVDEAPITYTSPPNESTIDVGAWLNGFYLAKILRDHESLKMICQTDPESLRVSSTRGPEYLYLYTRALRDFQTRNWSKLVDMLLAAVKATDPKRPDVHDKDWALDLHVPELEVLICVVTKDAKFGDALRRAVELHKEFWSQKRDYRMNSYRGFISVPLTALARMGLDQGLTFDVESPYIPNELLA